MTQPTLVFENGRYLGTIKVTGRKSPRTPSNGYKAYRAKQSRANTVRNILAAVAFVALALLPTMAYLYATAV